MNNSIPITGVVNANNLAEWFWDEVDGGFNLSEHNAILDWEKDHPNEELPDDLTVEEPEILLGDWQLSGKIYAPIQNGPKGFSAVLGWLGGAPIVHVVWSEHTALVNSMCSPCCPGQADIDSGIAEDGVGYLCYTLPLDWFLGE